MLKKIAHNYLVIALGLILIHLAFCIQSANADEPTLSNIYHMKIFKTNSVEFGYFTVENFLRHGIQADGSYNFLDDRWSYKKGEKFFIGVKFPKQLAGMSVFLKITGGNNFLYKLPARPIRAQGNGSMWGETINAKYLYENGDGSGIFSFEWWIGKPGSEQIAAMQLINVID